MSTSHELHTARVAEAFDNVAEIFENSLENETTRGLREKVYSVIESLVPAGASILDINCGIGIDAVALFRRGYRVVGVDISPNMIREAVERARQARATEAAFRVGSFQDLSSIQGKPFDLVLSNFGGLNCVGSLENVAEQVASITRPGGYFVAVVMPPFSLWELLAGLVRHNFNFAFRRLRTNVQASGFGGKSFTVSYFSPGKFASVFSRWFEVKQVRGFNIVSPPPHATRFVSSSPRLTQRLVRLEEMIAAFPLLRSIGDHYLMVLRRKTF
ncbi:MAG: class I SAM-dependent methyltransferase [Bacteroidota bacterium]